MSLAFTAWPAGYDAASYMTRGHKRLTAEGLDETHFDVVAGHLVRALTALKVPQPLIEEAVAQVAPLRGVFQRDAEAFKATSAAS